MSLAQILSQNLRASGIPKRFQPLLGQAGNEALVRFGPQYDQLNQLREQSALQMRQAQAQATSAAQLIAALAGQQRSAIQSDTTNPAIQQALAYQKAPEGSSTQRVGLGLALGRDATSNILSQVAANAPIAAAQQGQQAAAQHLTDLQKINAQRASLLGELGNYVTGRTQDLIGADRKQRSQLNQNLRTVRTRLQTAELSADTQRRGQDITARGQDLSHADRQAALNAKGTGKLPGGVKLNTPQQHGALKDSVGSAVALVQKQKQLGRSRHEIAGLLISGRPAQTITLSPGDPGYDPSNPAKNKVSVPAVPKVSQLALSIALDQAFNQHVSGHNVNELHRRGYSVKTLGFPTTPPARKPRRPRQPVSGSYGPAGPARS